MRLSALSANVTPARPHPATCVVELFAQGHGDPPTSPRRGRTLQLHLGPLAGADRDAERPPTSPRRGRTLQPRRLHEGSACGVEIRQRHPGAAAPCNLPSLGLKLPTQWRPANVTPARPHPATGAADRVRRAGRVPPPTSPRRGRTLQRERCAAVGAGVGPPTSPRRGRTLQPLVPNWSLLRFDRQRHPGAAAPCNLDEGEVLAVVVKVRQRHPGAAAPCNVLWRLSRSRPWSSPANVTPARPHPATDPAQGPATTRVAAPFASAPPTDDDVVPAWGLRAIALPASPGSPPSLDPRDDD